MKRYNTLFVFCRIFTCRRTRFKKGNLESFLAKEKEEER